MVGNPDSFLQEQIVYPLLNDNPHYTFGETVLYGLAFLFFVWLASRFFEKMKIDINFNFLMGWSGWILIMAGTRVLEDQGVLTSRLFITPFNDVFFVSIAFFLIFILKMLEVKGVVDFYSVWMRVPYMLFIPILFYLSYSNLVGGLYILLIFSFIIGLLLFLRNKSSVLSRENMVAMSSHILDASATFVAMSFFGAFEKHIVPNMFIGTFGPIAMFPLKIAVVGVALYYIDKEVDNDFERRFFKLMIFSLGLGPGLRGLIQVIGY
ncbi:MAG: DUF63 family protein [Nanohaloarchaea archaeon]|nr:DUF63 family protein [Candidatus Nanohaloarchaea archaeon]